jgi:hypothetical protein
MVTGEIFLCLNGSLNFLFQLILVETQQEKKKSNSEFWREFDKTIIHK